jgi:hypothetical protein
MLERITEDQATKKDRLPLYIREGEILDWLKEAFEWNSGYDSKVPFDFSDRHYTLFHIDTEFNKVGMTRFQGVVLRKLGGIHYASSESVMPLELLKMASSYGVYQYDEMNHLICWTVWFDTPITQEIWDNQIKFKKQ